MGSRQFITEVAATHRPLINRLACFVVAGILAMGLLAGGSTGASPTDASVLGVMVHQTSFGEVKQAIDKLYRDHPGITSFTVKDVVYSAKSRDAVLSECNKGSIAASASEWELQRVAACAPLIFYYESYGRQRSVPEAVVVARQLYWYATTSNQQPYDATKTLQSLLRSWGVL
jgi:hypothetical protein